MKVYASAEIAKFNERPGMVGTFTHGERVSLTHWVFEKDAVLPVHSHRHEQITYVVSGEIRFETGDGNTTTAPAGTFVVFAPNEPHGGAAGLRRSGRLQSRQGGLQGPDGLGVEIAPEAFFIADCMVMNVK